MIIQPKLSAFVVSIVIANICLGQVGSFIKENIRSTVLIYKIGVKGNLETHGVGFSLYQYDTTINQYFGSPLVTCKHLTNRDTLVFAIPAADSIKKELREQKISNIRIDNDVFLFDGNNFLQKIPLKVDSNLFRHPSLDLAIIYFRPAGIFTFNDGKKIRLSNLSGIPKSFIGYDDDLQIGYDIAFIGFPFGIGSAQGYQNTKQFSDFTVNPLIRKGIISWKSINSDLFLVDGFSYGGNSGSPVFSIPDFDHKGKFVGMVLGHLPEELQVSFLDSLNRVMVTPYFVTPNNGLAYCIPSYQILNFADEVTSRLRKKIGTKN